MAYRYLIYSTGTTYSTTIVRESATNNPGVNEASYYTDFVIPEIQPLYLWRVNNATTPTGVIPNTDANISAYEDAIAPPPTPDDLVTMGELTGTTAQLISKVTGATDNIAVFTADGGLQDGGYTIPELTGLTTYTFIGSGDTVVTQVGNAVTIKSTVPTGTTVSWGTILGTLSNQTDLWADLQLLSGATTGNTADIKANYDLFTGFTASTEQEFTNVYNEIDYISGQTVTHTQFNSYTGATQPILNAALTGVTNLGTGTTLGGTSGRNITIKSISAVGGVTLLGDTNNLIISGQTNVATTWGNITGTLSNQTDLWAQLTGMTAETATKLDTSVFQSYTGTTETRLQGIENDIAYVSGQTDTKLSIVSFTGYSATTDTRISNLEDDATQWYAERGNYITGATNGIRKTDGHNIVLGGALTQNTTISGLTYGLTANTKNVLLQAINGISIIDTDGAGGVNIESDAGTIALIGNTNLGVERTKLEISQTQMLITDSRATQVGLQYAADYSTTFTDESLITKRYADAIAGGLIPKEAVLVATTGAITLSGLSTIDGVALSNGNRVLVKNQASAATNGIYVASGSTWARATDYDGNPGGEVSSGNIIPVISGNSNHNSLWVLVTPNPITIGVTALNFSLYASPHYSAGHGIGITGNTIYVNGSALDGNSLLWSGGTFNVDITTGTLGTALTNINNDIDYISGQTVTHSQFNSYTGATETRLQGIESDVAYISGQTDTKLDIAVFTGYSATTETRLQGIESDIIYISGVTDSNWAAFTGFTASTASNEIHLVHTGGTNINTVAATPIPWHTQIISGSNYSWTGGTNIKILNAGNYEITYNIPFGHSGTNNVRGIGGNIVVNGATIINRTASAGATSRSGMIGALNLATVVATLAANDIITLIGFRTGLAGTSNTVVDGSILIKKKNTLQ